MQTKFYYNSFTTGSVHLMTGLQTFTMKNEDFISSLLKLKQTLYKFVLSLFACPRLLQLSFGEKC